MSHKSKHNGPTHGAAPVVAGPRPPLTASAEATVRQLIANGKSKVALDNAKELHKAHGSAASETLLLDAYAARIESLMQHNLDMEAKALIQLVSERYPAARERFRRLGAAAAARTGAIDELLAPLKDPALSPERRAGIEQAVRAEIADLAAVAGSELLGPEHPLRVAAAILDRTLTAVSSGPVHDDALELPEVSRRSPLASWKPLVRAIASFYRGDGESCRRHVQAIEPGSVPARLVPAIAALAGGKSATELTQGAESLVRRVTGDSAEFARALEDLDRAFEGDEDNGILRAISLAVQECRRCASEQLDRLKQHISVRCAALGMDTPRVVAAMGGPARHDAYFRRLHAVGMERTGVQEDLVVAVRLWEEFRQAAVEEGWFPPNGVEAAALYLHMAELLRELPAEMLRQIERRLRQDGESKVPYYFSPEQLYQRACSLDPHFEAFSQWMSCAAGVSPWRAELVAESWHKIRPQDLDPILYLMERTSQRRAFDTALKYLGKAEQVNGVHPSVRRARLRLLAGSAMRHIEKKKPHLAERELVEIAALPQSQQGDRPAFLAALRCMLAGGRGDETGALLELAEMERLLGGRAAANLLLFAVAELCRRGAVEKLPPPEKLSAVERASLPVSLIRVASLTKDLGVEKLFLPWRYVVETAKQFPQTGASLDTAQLRTLAELALALKNPDLAWAASSAGLHRGGGTEARFLFLRAQSLAENQYRRRAVLTAAAAELAREQRDLDLVDEALGFLRGPLECEDLNLTPQGAAEMLRREKALPKNAGRKAGGPYYRDVELPERCDCPDCRRARGEFVEDHLDDDEHEDLDDLFDGFPAPPPEMPREVAKALFEETRKAIESGESMGHFLDRIFGGGPPRGGRRKGRSKK